MSSVTPGSVPTRTPAALAAPAGIGMRQRLRRRTQNDVHRRHQIGDLRWRLLTVRAPRENLHQHHVVAQSLCGLMQGVSDLPQRLVGDDEDRFARPGTHAVADGDGRRRQQFGRG